MDVRGVRFRVGREARVGGLFSPSLEGSWPAVLLLHGFPGVEKNEDIAAELCRRGIAAFSPFFRGCWGSGGTYLPSALLDDAKASLALLSRYPHIDEKRLGVLGLSVGGWVALRLAAGERLAAAAAMAPAVFWRPDAQMLAYVRQSGRVIRMAPAQDIMEDAGRALAEPPPEAYLPLVSPCPLLLVHGLRDATVPFPSSRRLIELARQPKELVELPEEGHEFQTDRAAVVKLMADWFEARLAAKVQAKI